MQIMDALLQRGHGSLKDGKLSESECFFSEIVKKCQNQEPRDYVGSKPAFLGLVDVYMEYGFLKSLADDKRQEMLIKAAVMCHYVINLGKKRGNQEKGQDGDGEPSIETSHLSEISSRLYRIEVELFRTMNVNSEFTFHKNTVEHKMALVKLRKRVEGEISNVEKMVDFSESVEANEDSFADAMTGINHTICSAMKDIVQRMITECQLVLGNPPCDYVAVGLGSFALGTMTPYSDLEWAILLDVEDESFKNYFRNLSRLVHFELVCLGETIVPSVMVKSLNSEQDSWFYDDVTPRGFAADGAMPNACKTPLGRSDDLGNIVFELIHSPELMAQFQNREWLNKSLELSASLRCFRVLYMSNPQKGKEIVSRYKQEVRNQLEFVVEENSSLPAGKELLPSNIPDSCCLPKELKTGSFRDQGTSGRVAMKLAIPSTESSDVEVNKFATMRNHHTKKIMENDIPRYHLHDVICTSDSEGMMYNLKKDLYRQPERLLCILFLKFGIEGANVYEGIDELHKRGFINATLKRNLIISISIACELRLRAYLDYDRQLEELDIPSFISCCSETANETSEAQMTKARLDRLVAFYRIVLPFLEKVMEMKGEANDEKRPINWKDTDLNYSPFYYNALIHLRLLRYDDAKYFSMKAIHGNPTDPTNWKVLARLLEKQGKYAEAFVCQWKSFCIHFAGNEKILCLSLESNEELDMHEGGAIRLESGIGLALANTARPDMHFLSRSFHRMGLSLFFSSQYQRAWRFFRIVHHLLQTFPYLRRGDAVPALFCNIALCLSAAGRYDEAIDIFKTVLKMENFLSAIQVPKARDNLGNAYLHTGNYPQALREYRLALKLRRNYYRSSNSPFLVISLVNIANALSNMGQVMKSIEYYQEALKLIQRIFANPHASYTELCLSGIGQNLIFLGKYGEALKYCQRSAESAKKRQHRDLKTYAMAVQALGNCYLFLNRFDDAVITYKESVSLFQQFNMGLPGQGEAVVLPHEFATVCCNLAVALLRQGKFQVASQWLQSSEEKMGSCRNRKSHPNMGIILHTKAQVLRSQGKTKEAKELMEKVIEIFNKAFGKDCPHFWTITAMICLGDLLVSQRQFVAAVERYGEALRLLYGDTIPMDAFIQLKISAHKNMGYSHYQLKQISDAITCYEEALSIWRSTQNEKSPNEVDKSVILSLHVEAGNAYIRNGNQHQAVQLYEVAVSTPVSVSYGVCDLKQVAWTLATMQLKAGLLLEAIGSFEKAIFLHTEYGKGRDTFVVKCYQNQAALYGTLGEQENDCLLSEKALGIQLAISNSQPLETTAKLLAQVAEAWSHRNTQKALEFCRRSVQMIEKLEAPAALKCNVFSDLGFYCHLHGLKKENLSEQQCLFEEAEVSYSRALGYQRNEPTLFNMGFLFMSTFHFVEAITPLNDILEGFDKHSKLGMDSRDAKVINAELREKLFSLQSRTKVVVRSLVFAHCLKFHCYKALGDKMNARSEVSKLIGCLTEVENPEDSDHTLLTFTLREMEKLES